MYLHEKGSMAVLADAAINSSIPFISERALGYIYETFWQRACEAF